MTRNDPPSPLDDLGARIKSARAAEKAGTEPAGRGFDQLPASTLGLAFRVGTELVAGLVVGVGMGYLLDAWLGTGPWLLVVFFFLGSGAGVMNVFRAASGLGMVPGYRPAPNRPPDRPGDRPDEDAGTGDA